jgi:hypothetical protein
MSAQLSSWWGDMERRVPLLTLATAGAGALGGLGLIMGFIGLIVTSS